MEKQSDLLTHCNNGNKQIPQVNLTEVNSPGEQLTFMEYWNT